MVSNFHSPIPPPTTFDFHTRDKKVIISELGGVGTMEINKKQSNYPPSSCPLHFHFSQRQHPILIIIDGAQKWLFLS
jgi:hypothetical protein